MTQPPNPQGLNHRFRRADAQVIFVSLHGHIRMAEAPALRELTQAIIERPAKRCIVDLADVSYVDSTGLGMLTAMHRRTDEQGCRLTLLDPSETVLSVLRLAKLDTVFDITSGEEASQLRRDTIGETRPEITQHDA